MHLRWFIYLVKYDPARIHLFCSFWIQHHGLEGSKIRRVDVWVLWTDVDIIRITVTVIVLAFVSLSVA